MGMRGNVISTKLFRWAGILRSSTRALATRREQLYDEAELAAARQWLARLNPDTIPRSACEISFSRSSGPGGQNVNKVSSKATLRISTSTLFSIVPRPLHQSLLNSRYHASKSADLVIQADEARKQSDNVNSCFRKLTEIIQQAGRDAVPNETSPEQRQRVDALQKAEAAGRRRMKEYQSRKKGLRRGDEF